MYQLSLAPLQGMTVSCYRNAYEKYFGGIDDYYTPFIATTDIKKASPLLLKDLLPEKNTLKAHLVPQLLSNNGHDFKHYASMIVQMGYEEINWNIGCPYPMVTNKKKGSGILPYPRMIQEFLEVVCSDLNYQLTVKMRLGLEDTEEGPLVMGILNQYPLKGVIIHARTGEQIYTGHVNLDAFEDLIGVCKHEVTYNGDIFTYEDFLRVKQRFPSVTRYMLGRGALRNPFLPSTIQGKFIPMEDRILIINRFHDEIYHYYRSILSGDKHLLDKMKEFWEYLSVHLDSDGKLLKSIKKCHSSTEYTQKIQQFLKGATWQE